MQHFLGDPESKQLNLEACQLALAIAKKILDENHFRNVQKTMDRKPPSFQQGDIVYFKNKQPEKWDLKWRPRYRIVCIACKGHYLHIENQAKWKIRSCNVKDIVHKWPIWVLDHWHAIWQSHKVHQTSCQLTNHHTQQLNMHTLLM